MKKRILTVLLAVCLVVALGTVTAAAADETETFPIFVGETGYENLAQAVLAAQNGDVIRLESDVELTVPEIYTNKLYEPIYGNSLNPLITIRKNLTIDLNAHNISIANEDAAKDFIGTIALFGINGSTANVTITGNGTIDSGAGENDVYGFDVCGGGKLTIEDATITGVPTAIQVTAGDLIIYGGNFKLANTVPEEQIQEMSPYLINAIDGTLTDKTSEIAVYGGTFENFDPTNVNEGEVTSLVPTGINVTTDGGRTVVRADTEPTENSAAEVNGIYFDSLEKAIGAALNGDTVTLVKDVNENINIEENKVVTLDLAGYTVTSPNESTIKGEITINDSSNGLGEYVGTAPISVESGKVTLNGGNIKIENIKNGYGIYCSDGGTAVVNGGIIQSTYAPLAGNNTTGDMYFTVNGGELTAQYGPAVYMPGQVELTITGGVLNGGISLRMGQVNISGGTIYATNDSIDDPSEYYTTSGNVWFPDALYVLNGTYTSGNEKGNSLDINITGGEFICENEQGSAVAIYDLGKVKQDSEIKISNDAVLVTNASDRDAYQVLSLSDIGVGTPESGYGYTAGEVGSSISGGTFSTAVDKEYLDSSINYELSSNGKFTYYTTFAEAMAAANEGDTINFVGDESDITVHTVTIVNNGVKTTVEVIDSFKLTMPDSRNGYTFGGWRGSDGKVYKAGETVTINTNMTFTAIWNAINVPDTYDIDLIVSDGGEAKTNLSNASAGTTITVTATPDEGYKLDYITVDGERISGTSFKMPAHDVTVRVYFTDGTSTLPFTDVRPNQWFYDAVAYVYTNGMMEGDSATTFNPDGQMTRAMFWAVLGRIDGANITGANWIDTARTWAMSKGVSDGTDPNGLVTREMMVTMLWRYVGEPASDYSLSAYTDASSVSDWAAEAMAWAVENGVISGVSATTLAPQGTATRAQCATIFMRYDADIA